MKIKTFIYDIILVIVISILVIMLFPKYYDSYTYYIKLYRELEQSTDLLKSAYWYQSVSFMIVALGFSMYTLLSLISGLLLKYNDRKFSLVFILITVFIILVIILSTYFFGTSINAHTILIVFNTLISICLAVTHSIMSYFNNKKLLK